MAKRIETNLKRILDERGISQKELAIATGIREATISDLCRNAMRRYPKDVLEKIMDELNLKNIDELLIIVDE